MEYTLPFNLNALTIPAVQGLDNTELATVNRLLQIWAQHFTRNRLKQSYYYAKEQLNSLTSSIPDEVRASVGVPAGWAGLAVRSLSDKTNLLGFNATDETEDLVKTFTTANPSFCNQFDSSLTDTYTYGCSFVGLIPNGEKTKAVFRSADYASAEWDTLNYGLKSCLAISDMDDKGNPTALVVWIPSKVISLVKASSENWVASIVKTKTAQCLAVALTYDSTLSKPLGHSRITPVVRNLCDSAFRTVVRMECASEFYAVPHLWILGMSKKSMREAQEHGFSNAVSAFRALGVGKDGEPPKIFQESTASMQPYGDVLQRLASLMASETGLSPQMLGVQLSNPTSAEALIASEDRLLQQVEKQNKAFSGVLTQLLKMFAIESGYETDEIPSPIFAPVRVESLGQKANFYTSVSAVYPEYAQSTVGLLKLGLTPEEIASIRTESREFSARKVVESLLQNKKE